MGESIASNPFVAILGADLDKIAPPIRTHLTQASGTRHYRGTLRAFWRRGGWPGRIVAAALRFANWSEVIRPERTVNLTYELRNWLLARGDGCPAMVWQRTAHFRRGARRHAGVITLVPDRGTLIDALGPLHVELIPRVVGDAVVMDSGRQWFALGRLRIPLPARLCGPAAIREWAEPDGRIGLRLSISNPLLGDYLGYEAILELVEEGESSSRA